MDERRQLSVDRSLHKPVDSSTSEHSALRRHVGNYNAISSNDGSHSSHLFWYHINKNGGTDQWDEAHASWLCTEIDYIYNLIALLCKWISNPNPIFLTIKPPLKQYSKFNSFLHYYFNKYHYFFNPSCVTR